MLFYCLFLCDSLREARDRSNKGKPWIPSPVTLLPWISDHNSSLICSSARWLSTSYSNFSMTPGWNSLEMRRSQFSVHVLHKCQRQPKHQPAPVSVCCPACVAPAPVTAGDNVLALLMAHMWHSVAEEPPLSLCLSHTDTRSDPRNTSWLRELFWLNCPLRQPRVLKLVWDEVSWTEPRAWAGSQKGQLCPYHELLWAVPTVRVI